MTQQTGQWSGFWTWQPASHQWTWTWTYKQPPSGAQVSGYGMFGQPDAAEATQIWQMLSALAQIGAQLDAQEPGSYSTDELDQIEVGLQQALAGIAGLRGQITAG